MVISCKKSIAMSIPPYLIGNELTINDECPYNNLSMSYYNQIIISCYIFLF